MRVTKNECSILVEQILQKRKDEYAIKSKSFINDVEKYFRSITDPKVLEVYESHPKYFNKLYFSVRGAGIGKNINVPTMRSCSHTVTDTNEKIVKISNELCEMYSKVDQARESLMAHLLSLRTLERIKEQFPEVTIEPKGKTMELSMITPDLLNWVKS
jgi:hypothetical protein